MPRPDSLHQKSPMTALVLQGGGALGAYQAGAYEALAERAQSLDWVAGISIGAINAALIAGNPRFSGVLGQQDLARAWCAEGQPVGGSMGDRLDHGRVRVSQDCRAP